MTDIECQYIQEFAWGLPIEYKGALLYPIAVENIFLFNTIIASLLTSPLEYPNEKYQTMSRLKFLIAIAEIRDRPCLSPDEEPYRYLSDWFIYLMQLVFKGQQLYLDVPKNGIGTGKNIRVVRQLLESAADAHSQTTELVITPREFEHIRKLILHQNGVDFSYEEVPVPMRRRYEEDMKYMSRASKTNITGENNLDLVSLSLGVSRDSLRSMTMREFNMKSAELYAKEVYLAELQGSMSGFVKLKREPEHWLHIKTQKERILEHFKSSDEIKTLMDDK